MRKKSCLLVVIVVIAIANLSFSLLHEYYISITSIDYNSESKSLEITQQFIAHDVEKAVFKKSNIDLNLAEPNEHPKADSILFAYILEGFLLTSQAEIELNWIGREVNLDETLWVYLQSSPIEKPTKLQVTNTTLTELFVSQSNITHVNFGTKQKTQAFHRQKTEHTFTIE